MARILIPAAVRAVIFDAVGTLIHPEPSAAAAYAVVGRRWGSRWTEADLRGRFREAFRHEETADAAAGWRTDERREEQRWRRIVATVLDDVRDPEACFQELFEHFARPESWRITPEAPATLAALAERGYQLGIASNYDYRLRRVVAGWPALTAVPHLIISSEVGWRKPGQQFFQQACSLLDTPPEQVLHIGDDARNDFDGARAAGLMALLYDSSGQTAAHLIRDLGELAGESFYGT